MMFCMGVKLGLLRNIRRWCSKIKCW